MVPAYQCSLIRDNTHPFPPARPNLNQYPARRACERTRTRPSLRLLTVHSGFRYKGTGHRPAAAETCIPASPGFLWLRGAVLSRLSVVVSSDQIRSIAEGFGVSQR